MIVLNVIAATRTMKTDTQQIWDSLKEPLFYFILKRVKNDNTAKDILQEVFIKIHLNLNQLKNESKVKAWAFQITRNQVAEYFRKENKLVELSKLDEEYLTRDSEYSEIDFCCFEKLINELPEKYSKVLTLISVEGKKQNDVASILHLSLANVKSRVRRAKEMLKQKFVECCQFSLNDKGLLVGEQNCQRCTCSTS